MSRELFTDLNKNAKQVNLARELILDDLSIERGVCAPWSPMKPPPILPTSFRYRWCDGKDAVNRFDQNYYVNSLVHLKLLLDTILDLSPPRDPMEKDKVEKFIKSLNTSLGTAPYNRVSRVASGDRTLMEVFAQDYCDPEGTSKFHSCVSPRTSLSLLKRV